MMLLENMIQLIWYSINQVQLMCLVVDSMKLSVGSKINLNKFLAIIYIVHM
jgi:hypothetical protein